MRTPTEEMVSMCSSYVELNVHPLSGPTRAWDSWTIVITLFQIFCTRHLSFC